MSVELTDRVDARDQSAPLGAALDIQGVGQGFLLNGAVLPVLQDIGLRAAPGEFVALLGPSGCGKSTLLRLVAGLEAPRRGGIMVDSAAVRGPDPSRVLVFQGPTLFPWRTVWQNTALGLQAQRRLGRERARVDDALMLVGLTPFARAYPRQSSGGMAERAALARALINDPRLLILDEPLGKLDSLTRLATQSELSRLWRQRGFAALMVTHDVEEALLLASRVVVLSDRPARVRADLPVDLPWPRHRDDPCLLALRREALLGIDATW